MSRAHQHINPRYADIVAGRAFTPTPSFEEMCVRDGVPPAPSIVVCGTLHGWALRFAADGELIAEFATADEAWAALKDARRLALMVGPGTQAVEAA